MTTDIIEINNFIVLIEESNDSNTIIEKCHLDDQVIGLSFYSSGNVEISINYKGNVKKIHNTSGIVSSFYGNKNVEFSHKIFSDKPLKSVSVFSTIKNIKKLPKQEKDIYLNNLSSLMNAKSDYAEGPYFYMNTEMLTVITKIFNTQYKGYPRKLFLQSQINELLAHFFAHLEEKHSNKVEALDHEKLLNAKEIITNNMATPPTLSELSKMIGLNNNKLKKNFKELFGVPVFKYLQNERLTKAYDLLQNSEMNVQEIAWHVGYESLSSFSNAFYKKFGMRPSELNK